MTRAEKIARKLVEVESISSSIVDPYPSFAVLVCDRLLYQNYNREIADEWANIWRKDLTRGLRKAGIK